MPISELPTFTYDQTLRGSFHLPARMTVLPLGEGKIALVSPIPIDDALAKKLRELGQVQYLIAPNMLHDLYLSAAIERYPEALVLTPPALAKKRPALPVHGTLDAELPGELSQAVEVIRFRGAPGVDEYVFYHRATRTLVVTDLAFNIERPRGLLANVVLFLMGCHRRFGQSRSFRYFVKDRSAAAEAAARMLSLPFQTLVMAHGEIVRDDAQAKLAGVLRWLTRRRPALPAAPRALGEHAESPEHSN